MTKLLENRTLAFFVRFSLGLVFLYSAWPKIADPPAFAEMIWNYRILPGVMVNPLAIILPWLELLAGLALISGWLRKGAALTAGCMLIVFIAALSVDLIRGIAVDCGCFSVVSEAKTTEQLFAAMKLDLVRDAALLLLSAFVLLSRSPIATASADGCTA
jgi:putative oxidoreductase